MPAKLLYRDAQGQDAAYDLPEAQPVFLGRAADCAIRTDDAMVSRKNCKLSSVGGGHFVVEDLGSSNGTFINERRIQKQQLAHGDIIRCGSLQVRYVEVAAAQTPMATAPTARPPAATAAQPNIATAYQPSGMGGPASFGQPQPQPMGPGVDPALVAEKDGQIAALTAERDEAKKALKDAQNELEPLRTKVETADSELKRLRQESSSSREELSKIRREASNDKEELTAVQRVVDEMRRDLKTAKDAVLTLKSELDEKKEDFQAKERQVERAQEDLGKAKKTIDELRAKMAEQQKTKDEGWRELNNQLSQLEQLREVIQEQERILEERRVGLIAIESAAKDLRAEKERLLVENVDLKNQRDDLKDKLNRQTAVVEGLEEEHRRMARAAGGGGASGEELQRVSSELRDVKVEMKKLEADKARAVDNARRIEEERDKAANERDRLEVDRQHALDEKKVAETAAKKNAEELRAVRAQLEAASAGGGAASEELERRATRAESRAADLEEDLRAAQKKLAAAAAAPAAHPVNGDAGELKTKAKEVYEGINEALSELRTTILTAKGLFGEIAPTVKDEDARGAIVEAIKTSMERAEDAKGLLRGLRELAEN